MKPRHSKPDANQLEIEKYLQSLGFITYRTANDAPQTNAITQIEFHPLDLLVLGINRNTDRVEFSLWEIKYGDKADFTEQEMQFIHVANTWFDRVAPVMVARNTDDILQWYGWLYNEE